MKKKMEKKSNKCLKQNYKLMKQKVNDKQKCSPNTWHICKVGNVFLLFVKSIVRCAERKVKF